MILPFACAVLGSSCTAPQLERNPQESPYWSMDRGRPKVALDLVVATYNVHGLPWPFARGRSDSMDRIVEQLVELPERIQPDVIAFQEAWTPWYRSRLINGLSGAGYGYAHFFSGHRWGTGLLIVSRFPIVETNLHSYEADAPWHRSGMDWWGGKGAGLVRIQCAPGMVLDVYNTHLVADYGGSESNNDTRMKQELELAQFLRASPPHLPCIVLGDFNDAVGERPLDTLLERGGLRVLDDGHGLDHILWREVADFECKVVEFARLEKSVDIGGKTYGLSDHACRIAKIHLQPGGVE